MYVAVATAVVGITGAVLSSEAQKSAANKAARSSQEAARDANATQLYMYDTAREDFAPFREPANRAMATLQSAIYGGPQWYTAKNPELNQYREMTADEIEAANIEAYRQGYRPEDPSLWEIKRNIDNTLGSNDPQLRAWMNDGTWSDAAFKYNPNQKWFIGPNGELVQAGTPGTPGTPQAAAPSGQAGGLQATRQMQATYQPQESEGFKYTKQRTLDDLGRQLRMMGRGSGTVAANAYGRTLGDLNASNEDKQYGRLIDLIKIGQGAAGSVASAGQNYANNVSNNQMQTGNTLAQLAINKGKNQSDLYSGIGDSVANAYGTYQIGKYLNSQE